MLDAMQHGHAVIKVKRSGKQGKQSGGFLPLLAASLAAPLLEAGVRKMMGKGPTITATPAQYDKIAAQIGSGKEIVANFRISTSKAHVQLGGSIIDKLTPYLLKAANAALPFIKKTAMGVGEKLAGDVVKPLVSKAKQLGKKVGKAVGITGSGVGLAGRRTSCGQCGTGTGLAGTSIRRGGAKFKQATSKSMLKSAAEEATKHNRRLKKKMQEAINADLTQGAGFAMKHLL